MAHRRHLSSLAMAVACLCLFVCMNSNPAAEPNYFGANHVIPPARNFSSANCYRSVPSCSHFKASSNAFQCLDVTLPYRQTFPPVSISSGSSAPNSNSSSSPGPAVAYGNNNSEQSTTSTQIENFDSTIKAINEYLSRWNGLRAIPQCWKALQYVLCSSFFPKCEDEGAEPKIFLPTYDMCRAIRNPCRLVEQHFRWPEWLHCENQSLFSQKSSHCSNEYKEMKLSPPTAITGGELFRCHPPLVNTDDKSLWYPGIDGCALRCDGHSLYGEVESSRMVRKSITYGTFIGLLLTIAGVTTMIGLKKTRYPTRCIFYVNLCLLLSYLSWTLQQLFKQTEFTCREDNTVRHGKGNATCIASFVLIYYFSLAAMFWLVIFAYGMMVVFRPKTTLSEKPRDKVRKDKSVFHFIAWFMPFIFTLIIIWFEEIDGDSLFGICFVGFAKPNYFIVFVIIPVTFNLVLYIIFMTKTLIGLSTCLHIYAEKFTDKKKETRRKMCNLRFRIFFSIVWSVFIYITFISVYFYQQQSLTKSYNHKLNQHIICSFNITDALEPKQNDSEAALTSSNEVHIQEITETEPLEDLDNLQVDPCAKLKPVLELWPIFLQIFCNFSTCILATLWICSKSVLKSWNDFFRKKFDRDGYNKTMNYLKRGTPKTVCDPQSQTDNNNYRKRQIDTLLATQMSPCNLHNHWDPLEMEFSSVFGSNFYAYNNDHMYAFMTTSENKHLQTVGGSTTTTINDDTQFVSECHNSITQLSRSLDSISCVESVRGRRVRKKTTKHFGRLLKRQNSDTSDLSIASVAACSTSYHSNKPKISPPDLLLLQKLQNLQELQQLQQLQMQLQNQSISPALVAANLASTLSPPPQQQMPYFPPNPYLSYPFPGPQTAMLPPPYLPQFGQNPVLQSSLNYYNKPQQQQQQQPNRGQFSHNITAFQGNDLENMSTAIRPPGAFLSGAARFHHQMQPFQFPTPGSFARAPIPPFQARPAPPAVRRPSDLRLPSFTFTHGYSMGSGSQVLVNPLEVKRRPDSRVDTNNHIMEFNKNCVVQAAADCTNYYNAAVPVQSQNPLNDYVDQLIKHFKNQIKDFEKQITATAKANYRNLNYPWITNGELYNSVIASECFERLQRQQLSDSEYNELIKERELYKEVFTNTNVKCDSRLSTSSNMIRPIICNSDSEISILSALTRMSFNSNSKIKERQKLDEHMQKISGKSDDLNENAKAKTTQVEENHEKSKKEGKTQKSSRKSDKQRNE